MARLQVGSHVRLKSTKGVSVVVDGQTKRIEGSSDGVIIGSIDAKKWRVKFLNGTPDGIVATLSSGQLVNKNNQPEAAKNTASSKKSTSPSPTSSSSATSTKASSKKK